MYAFVVRRHQRLAKLVHEEREQSSKPLCPHLCAACGQLLPALFKEAEPHQTGAAYQVLGKPCSGGDMPPFLLLFSKSLIGRRLPTIFKYDAEKNTLALLDVTKAPWIHYIDNKRHAPKMCEKTPWYYCYTCSTYWTKHPNRDAKPSAANTKNPSTAGLEAVYNAATNTKRMPMRNWMEGHFTAWHRDVAYCHLYPSLIKIYPKHSTLPSVADVLQWRQRKKDLKEEMNLVMEGDDLPKKNAALLERQRLRALELKWAPPPSSSIFETPIPARYFLAALGDVKVWSLSMLDLVPVEQIDLMQDAPSCPDWANIRSGDARACVSLCRPLTRITNKRSLGGKAGTLPTMPYHSGKTVHAALSLEQDVARGMLTGVVAKDSFIKEMFELKPDEPDALANVLPWLLKHNPWLGAYSTSLREVHKGLEELKLEMKQSGRLLPGGFEGLLTKDGAALQDHLDHDSVAQFLPIDSLNGLTGSYHHLRAMATTICTSSLRKTLPTAWQDLVEVPIAEPTGESISTVPTFLDMNRNYTNVSFLDSHVEAKLFVDKFRHGTGSIHSSLDCVVNLQVYRKGRMWSLDGEFICEEDPSWIFWQREHDIKMRLYKDWTGKRRGPLTSSTPASKNTPSRSARHEAAYSHAMFSQRVGSLIADSPQALTRKRYEWLEAARPENLGPPTGMTTFVSHSNAAPILAHAIKGPCAVPDPESSVHHLWGIKPPISSTGYVAIKSAEYLRRRSDFETVAFGVSGRDALHGQTRHWCRRTESQKKGDAHDHYNVFCSKCGFSLHVREMEEVAKYIESLTEEGKAAQKVTLSDGFVQTTCKDSHSDADCRLPCRYCAMASNHCVLPDSVRTSEFHKNCHHAYAQAELTRPFPLGHCPKLQPAVPDLAGKDLSASRSTLREELYGQRDTSASKLDGTVPIVTSTRPLPTLDERLFKVVASKTLLPEKFADEMGFGDLIASYYYRALQVNTFVHTCKLGYCRKNWADPCRFSFPVRTPQLVQALDEDTNRMKSPRTYLPDDAYLKVHILSILVRTLCNVQSNIHHPQSSINSLGYSIKYQLKAEPTVTCEQEHPADDAVTVLLKGQFVSMFGTCLMLQGDPPVNATFDASLAMPTWNAALGNRDWKNYIHRLASNGRLEDRVGWPVVITSAALEVSLLYAKFGTIIRYFAFHETRNSITKSSGADVPDDAGLHQESDDAPIHLAEGSVERAKGLSFKTWDSIPDQVSHPFYDPVLSMMSLEQRTRHEVNGNIAPISLYMVQSIS